MDEITINIRAWSDEALTKLYDIIDKELNDIPDETNEDALRAVTMFMK